MRPASVKVADPDAVSLGAEPDIAFNPRNPDDAFGREGKDMKLALYIPALAGIAERSSTLPLTFRT